MHFLLSSQLWRTVERRLGGFSPQLVQPRHAHKGREREGGAPPEALRLATWDGIDIREQWHRFTLRLRASW